MPKFNVGDVVIMADFKGYENSWALNALKKPMHVVKVSGLYVYVKELDGGCILDSRLRHALKVRPVMEILNDNIS